MTEMSREFLGDDISSQVEEALDETHAEVRPLRRPGGLGSVICTPLYYQWFGDELPPDDAA